MSVRAKERLGGSSITDSYLVELTCVVNEG